MATVWYYVTEMRARQNAIARKLGADITMADKHTRVLNASVLTVIGVVVKLLISKGVFTDVELVAALDAAGGAAYDPEPLDPLTGGPA